MAFNYNIAYLGQAHAPVQQSTVSLPVTNQSNQSKTSCVDLYLKVLSPENKKDYKTVSLRGLDKETIDTPAKLKAAIAMQCDGLSDQSIDIGYFNHSKKLWINSRLDVNDVWAMVEKGERVTLWCLDTSATLKRKRDEPAGEERQSKRRNNLQQQCTSTVEERRTQAKENEEKLMDLHKDKWTSFQYKLWAEMLVYGTHSSFEEPPSSSMFVRDKKHPSSSSHVGDDTAVGMVAAMSTLCQALIPKETPKPPISSPMKNAQLRGTYMKQLNELRQLYDSEILTKDEYEGQRSNLVKLMCQLNEK